MVKQNASGAMGNGLLRCPRLRGAVGSRREPATHPVPAPGSQPASIGAEATTAHRTLVFPELSVTGKVFYCLCQCQQLPWPEPHCEIFCIGKREKERFPERGSETGPQRQRQACCVRVMSNGSESQAMEYPSDKGQSLYEVKRQEHQALPALALQLPNSLLHLGPSSSPLPLSLGPSLLPGED